MASQKAWDAAHAHLSKAWLILGIIMLAITAVLMLALPIDAETFLLSTVIVRIVVMFAPMPFIERHSARKIRSRVRAAFVHIR